VVATNEEGHRRLRFNSKVMTFLDALGEVPLPPYIARPDVSQMDQDRQRYQTVYAQPQGSVAAPTAGLHFTDTILETIRSRGVQVCFLTLHVGLGTFAPVKTEDLAGHVMHEERYSVPGETVRLINQAKQSGGRIWAVGTTTVRVLETLAGMETEGTIGQTFGLLASSGDPRLSGKTRIFIYPPFDFKIVDVLLTNFHLPRSTLLMLVSAFAAPNKTTGRDLVLSAYAEAIRERYRFFSYGDAMLLL
jgi:S-adenosylmethionine:tRNA ribosyltransferase-isomerase